MAQQKIKLSDIRLDGNTQHRKLNEPAVRDYSLLMKEGHKFPPVEIVFDGTDYWLWDGFHRVEAARRGGAETIIANVVRNSHEHAVLLSYGANSQHGRPRQDGEIQTIIRKMMGSTQYDGWTDQAYAETVGASRFYINRVRNTKPRETKKKKKDETPEATKKKDDETPEQEPLETRTGKVAPEHLRAIFERIPEVKALIHDLDGIMKTCNDGVAGEDELFTYLKIDDFKMKVSNVRRVLRFCMPYATCGYCGGSDSEGCRACNGLGWVSELIHNATPPEMKR